jgi:hypothetical protein
MSLDSIREGFAAVDDVASPLRLTLQPVCFKLSSTLTEEQRAELAVELQFYGLLKHVMPYYVEERVGAALLNRACATGTMVGRCRSTV